MFTKIWFIFLLIKWLPESARYHVASGQTERALATIEQVNEIIHSWTDLGNKSSLIRFADRQRQQAPHAARPASGRWSVGTARLRQGVA